MQKTNPGPDGLLADKIAIRELIDRWIITVDSGLWDEFLEIWHEDGFMAATWFQASAKEIVGKKRDAGIDPDALVLHRNLGHMSDIAGDRAISQTKMNITQRAEVHGVLVDVTAMGRFYDFLEKRDNRWGMVRRQGIYEKDRLDPVDPAARLTLDQDLLNRFPAGYRHLAYIQTLNGFDVKATGLPQLTGPEVERLYAEGAAWLEGAPSPGNLDFP